MRVKLGEFKMLVGRGGGAHGRKKKTMETVTASLRLVFKGRGRNLAPPLIKSINNLFPGEKACQISERWSRKSIQCIQ